MNYRGVRIKSPTLIIIIVLNVVVFLMNSYFETVKGSTIVYDTLQFASANIVDTNEWWRIITSMFVHYGPAHLLCNLFSLVYISDVILAHLGEKKFALIYFVSGICGSFMVLGYDILMDRASFCGGASGAVCGMLGAILVLAFSKKRSFMFNKTAVIMVAAIMLLPGFVMPGISWQAHLGGLIGGIGITKLLDLIDDNKSNKYNNFNKYNNW